MKSRTIIVLLVLVAYNVSSLPSKAITKAAFDEADVREKLDAYDALAIPLCTSRSLASWAVETNVGVQALVDEYKDKVTEYAKFRQEHYQDYFREAIENMDNDEYVDVQLKRELGKLRNMGTAILSDVDLEQLTSVRAAMTAIYNMAKICPSTEPDCTTPTWSLDEEIQKRMSKSRNYTELEYIFTEWHDKSGKGMRTHYITYVDLMNKAATQNDFDDAGKMWISAYEDDNFIDNIDQLWQEVEPLYTELHKYVKHKLSKMYPGKLDDDSDTIPAHILGNMWAQTWEDLYEDLKPYKNAGSINIDDKLKELDVEDLFKMSDDFYQSMGLFPNDMSYGEDAMIRKPDDGRIVACHASAWDFCDRLDFRIKMCTHVDKHDFLVVHHEMGHIQYFLQYKDQPLIFRGGANPGFHEAIGDTISLSVDTAKHYKAVGLLDDDYVDSKESQINALFAMALKRVAFLPFGLLVDKWRWDIFQTDKYPEEEWNKHWWELREKYQKVSPPSSRDDSDGYFDPGAKFHIPNDSQYIAYFVAHMLQFQMYRALCIKAGEYDPATAADRPLHTCDFYESTDAGDLLAAGLSLGTSEPWQNALEAITNERVLSSDAILEYFEPLYDYLKEYNEVIANLKTYNNEAPQECTTIVKAEWDVNTDVENVVKQAALTTATLSYSAYLKEQAQIFENVQLEMFEDELEARQIREIKKLGTSVLGVDDLTKLQQTISGMEAIYNTATICAYEDESCVDKWSLDPEIENVMATSEDYNELLYVWKEWRDNTGKLMRDDYKQYVELSNLAAETNGYDDYGHMWRDMYEDDNFYENIESMWNEVKELYDELHKYVLNKLKKIYEPHLDEYEDQIPAHILGNMWAQSWVHLYDRTKPFTNGSDIDATEAIAAKYTDVKDMFDEANKFYTDLGLDTMDMSYGDNALISKPDDGRKVACHASAWDFCDGNDFRIKMCTNKNMEDFVTIHHEMGHIQYYLMYKNLPIALRGGANPGFHEAVGDLIALSVSTPQHLQTLELLEDYEDSPVNSINSLYKMALERVAFLPFGLIIDKWRWDIFSRKSDESNWNSDWWKLREEYQKVVAPVERSEDDFDPGAKYHVPADSKYISYFIAHILEFQLHRAVCIAAGQYDPDDETTKPLHKCDIVGSIEAGQKIRDGLSIGFSKHWSESLKAMTDETEISGKALMEYFAPLLVFLKEANSSPGETTDDPDSTDSTISTDDPNTSTDDPNTSTDDPNTSDDSSSTTPAPGGGDGGGATIGGDKGIVISIALIAYGVFTWIRN